jgi:hypothetical protein
MDSISGKGRFDVKNLTGIQVVLIVFGIIAFFVVCGLLTDTTGEGDRQPAPIVKGPLYNVPPNDVPPKKEATFHLSSSGRLPTALHGFKLGMSISDAKALEPNLMGEGRYLSGGTHEDYYVTLGFTENRLYSIHSSLTHISPADADDFDRSTSSQFGPPDKRIYEGPDAECWVWIDGDVRARYVNSEDGDRVSRDLDLEVVAYPTMVTVESTPHPSKLVRQVSYDWGESSEPFVLKSMPTEVDGLRLGMQPWEVRSVVPGIDISSRSEHLSQGFQGGDSPTGVAFWDGRLYQFNRIHENVSASQFAQTPQQMIAVLGTPIRGWQIPLTVDLTWEDQKIEIRCTWIDSKNNIPRYLSLHVEDKAVVRFVNATTQAPQFKTVSQTKSFF